jgi:hypothetical protein
LKAWWDCMPPQPYPDTKKKRRNWKYSWGENKLLTIRQVTEEMTKARWTRSSMSL